jgi:hypothetical protein
MSAENIVLVHGGEEFGEKVGPQALGLTIEILESANPELEEQIHPTLSFLRSAIVKNRVVLHIGEKRVRGVGLATDIIKDYMERNLDDAPILVPLHNALRAASFSASCS